MHTLFYLMIPIAFVLLINMMMGIAYKDVEKQDKGFVIDFYRLSNRRKFLRILWHLPFVIFVFISVYRFEAFTQVEYLIIAIVLFAFVLLNIIYYYLKRRKDENGRGCYGG